MSLLLTLVQAPQPQAVRQMRLDDGALVIGRSAEARLADRRPRPVRVARALHRSPAAAAPSPSPTPRAAGSSSTTRARRSGPAGRLPLRDGMRLRLGDYVLRVELARRGARPPPPAAAVRGRAPPSTPTSFFSEPRAGAAAPPSARATCPIRSSAPASFVPAVDTAPPERRGRPVFDDPFTLDPPTSSRHRERPAPPEFDSSRHAAPAASRPRRPRTSTGARPRRRRRAAPAPAEAASDFELGREPGEPAPTSRRLDWAPARRPSRAEAARPRRRRAAAPPRAAGRRAADAGAVRRLPARPRPRSRRRARRRSGGADGGLRPRVPDDGRGADAAPAPAGPGKGQRADRRRPWSAPPRSIR